MLKIIEQKLNTPIENQYVCTVVDINDDTQHEYDVILHMEEIELIKALNTLQSAANLYPPIMNDIWIKIQAYVKFQKNK